MKILFYLMPYNKPTMAFYQHQEVCLAEGFKELGIEYYGNINYWFNLEGEEYLIKKASEEFNPSLVIYSGSYFLENYDYIKLDNNKCNILIDNDDGINTLCQMLKAECFDFVLRSHYLKWMHYKTNVRPWAFGLSNRMIRENEKNQSTLLLEQCYINFRVSHNLRDLANKRMTNILARRFKIFNQYTDSLDIKALPEIESLSYWNQTGRRHNKEYYKILNSSILTLVFGGILQYKSIFHRYKESFEKIIGFYLSNNFYLSQFDSWRLWEGFLSNSCPVHVDFENWGAVLPEMPRNGFHYIGVFGMHFRKTANEINQMNLSDIKCIGQNGKNWVLTHYAPKPTSERFIKLMDT